MQLYLLRHATLMLTMGGHRILVDPMLNRAGATEPIANTPNQKRNPLVGLPVDDNTLTALIQSLDAVLVTHTHGDHWDGRARELLPKSLPIFCQPEDEQKIRDAGFRAVQAIPKRHSWQGIVYTRTGGQHGHGHMADLMAPVSGFVVETANEPAVYIAGDTVWCPEVEAALRDHQPQVVVVNAGAAQFISDAPITMTADDVLRVVAARPEASVVAVHMEAINHCLLSRAELREMIGSAGQSGHVAIPADGETMTFPAPG